MEIKLTDANETKAITLDGKNRIELDVDGKKIIASKIFFESEEPKFKVGDYVRVKVEGVHCITNDSPIMKILEMKKDNISKKEKLYYVKHKWLSNARSDKYLHVNKDDGTTYLFSGRNPKIFQTKFTKEEIGEFKLSDAWEIVEASE